MSVTRTELASHIEAAFNAGPATRDSLLAYAAGSHARPEVITLIHGLPDKVYPNLRHLWHDLGHLPVGS
jgi:hypothetical protein